MPVLAVFAAAPDMRYGEYAAVLVPSDHCGVVEGIKRDAVRAVPFQKRGVRAIELYTFSVHDGKGDQRSVVAFGFDFYRLEIGRSVKLFRRLQLCVGHVFFERTIVVGLARLGPLGQLYERTLYALIRRREAHSALEC